MKSPVLQAWVMQLGWKMQSILLSGLRAPDAKTDVTKKICRWMRAQCQNNADPSKGYMEPQRFSEESITKCMDELEYLPCHYVHHFADALRIFALYHSEAEVRNFAWKVHYTIAEEIFHFVPESDQQFTQRHRDKV